MQLPDSSESGEFGVRLPPPNESSASTSTRGRATPNPMNVRPTGSGMVIIFFYTTYLFARCLQFLSYARELHHQTEVPEF